MMVASFTPLDWLIAALLLYSTVRAFMRGLVLEIFSLVGLFAGILLASWNYPALAERLGRWLTPPVTADIVAFFLIAISVMVACGIAGKLLRSSASAIGLGFFDRLFGAAFGLARGCLLAVAVMMVVAAFDPAAAWTKHSRLAPYFLAGAHGVSFVVPHGLEQQISNGIAELKHTTPLWIKPPQ